METRHRPCRYEMMIENAVRKKTGLRAGTVISCTTRCLALLFVSVIFAHLTIATDVVAQTCYYRTSDHGPGNGFVKPTSDSTCLSQWFSYMYHFNFRTGEILFGFRSDPFFLNPHIANAHITDALLLDSLIVVSWYCGETIRFLKLDFTGTVSERQTVLDSIPLLKYSDIRWACETHRIGQVNDSIFIISNGAAIYSFKHVYDDVVLVDSLNLIESWNRGVGPVDCYSDTILVGSRIANELQFYHIEASGKIRFVSTVPIAADFRPESLRSVHYRFGNIYFENSTWYVLLRTPRGFEPSLNKTHPLTTGQPPAFGVSSVIFSALWDNFLIYNPDLTLRCQKPTSSNVAVVSYATLGDKIFIGRDEGLSSYIPDSSTTSLRSSDDPPESPLLRVWPNPSGTSTITVDCDVRDAHIDMTDVLGKVVFRGAQSMNGPMVISTTKLPPGIYFINAHTAEGTITERVVLLGTK
jgi:hypothetical protein